MNHTMTMALALLKIGLERERAQQRNSVQTRESAVRGENNMLRLHESLSTSLYKNKDRSNEKLSVKIVLFVTLVSTWLSTNLNFIILSVPVCHLGHGDLHPHVQPAHHLLLLPIYLDPPYVVLYNWD